jgi:hypothetical protein
MFKPVLRVDIEAIRNDIGLLSWPDPNGPPNGPGERVVHDETQKNIIYGCDS